MCNSFAGDRYQEECRAFHGRAFQSKVGAKGRLSISHFDQGQVGEAKHVPQDCLTQNLPHQQTPLQVKKSLPPYQPTRYSHWLLQERETEAGSQEWAKPPQSSLQQLGEQLTNTEETMLC